jgi:Ni2+-binding GTPase involved in maturation of urease and hydrogenase
MQPHADHAAADASHAHRDADHHHDQNVLAPPGAGKTTLLERTISALRAAPFRATDLVVVNKIDLTPCRRAAIEAPTA